MLYWLKRVAAVIGASVGLAVVLGLVQRFWGPTTGQEVFAQRWEWGFQGYFGVLALATLFIRTPSAEKTAVVALLAALVHAHLGLLMTGRPLLMDSFQWLALLRMGQPVAAMLFAVLAMRAVFGPDAFRSALLANRRRAARR